MGRIAIEAVRCKGCGRCITACPKDLIGFSNELNERGYNYVAFTGSQDDCSGCTICAVVCPDQGIEVWNFKDKQTFVTTAGLTANSTHYCPGCTHDPSLGRQPLLNFLRRHWPEYVMEGVELGLYMA